MSNDFVRPGSAADLNKKLDAEKLEVEGVEVYQLRVQSSALTLRMDDVGGGVLYAGEALPGTAESALAWRIKKVTSGGVFWANGNSSFVNAWDDRLSLPY